MVNSLNQAVKEKLELSVVQRKWEGKELQQKYSTMINSLEELKKEKNALRERCTYLKQQVLSIKDQHQTELEDYQDQKNKADQLIFIQNQEKIDLQEQLQHKSKLEHEMRNEKISLQKQFEVDCKKFLEQRMTIEEKLKAEKGMCNKYKLRLDTLEKEFDKTKQDNDKYANMIKKFEAQQKREKVDFELHSDTKNLLQIVTSERDALKSRVNTLEHRIKALEQGENKNNIMVI